MPDTPKNSATVAVVIGAAIGNGLAYAVLFVSGLVFVWYLVACGVPAELAYMRAHESVGYLIFAHTLAVASLVPGGYWTARLSSTSRIRNAVLAGLIVCTLTLLAYLMPYDIPAPWWSRVAAILSPLPAYLIGAVLHNRKSAASLKKHPPSS